MVFYKEVLVRLYQGFFTYLVWLLISESHKGTVAMNTYEMNSIEKTLRTKNRR